VFGHNQSIADRLFVTVVQGVPRLRTNCLHPEKEIETGKKNNNKK